MTRPKQKSKSGFSLIEVIVVVAVMGILLRVAIPAYQGFIARGQQSEAKSELTSIYVVEKSFYTQYSTFGAFLNLMGFIPEGMTFVSPSLYVSNVERHYDIGFLGSILLTFPCVASWPSTISALHTNSDYGSTNNSDGEFATYSTIDTEAVICSTNAFKAYAVGLIGGSLSNFDVWTMDQDKVLKNVKRGY